MRGHANAQLDYIAVGVVGTTFKLKIIIHTYTHTHNTAHLSCQLGCQGQHHTQIQQ